MIRRNNANRILLYFILKVASGPRVKLIDCKAALNNPVIYTSDHSKAMVPMLLLLCVALWLVLRGDLY